MTVPLEDLPPLSPAILEWLQRAAEISAALPGLRSEEPTERRRAERELSDLLAAEFTDPAPTGVEISDREVDGASGPCRARVFRTGGAVGPQPTLLWLHGGGWTGGTIDELLNDRICADRTLRSGVQIIALEYRLAPEHPFPAPVDDAVAALADLRRRADDLGIDAERLGVGGNSAWWERRGIGIAPRRACRAQRDSPTSIAPVPRSPPPPRWTRRTTADSLPH
nr:alpha/beta hydrolase [Microbacterium barkeri]